MIRRSVLDVDGGAGPTSEIPAAFAFRGVSVYAHRLAQLHVGNRHYRSPGVAVWFEPHRVSPGDRGPVVDDCNVLVRAVVARRIRENPQRSLHPALGIQDVHIVPGVSAVCCSLAKTLGVEATSARAGRVGTRCPGEDLIALYHGEYRRRGSGHASPDRREGDRS